MPSISTGARGRTHAAMPFIVLSLLTFLLVFLTACPKEKKPSYPHCAPEITEISPACGNSDGSMVTISGSDLGAIGDAKVLFDGLEASIIENTGSLITCTSPAHAPGEVDVVVERVCGSSSPMKYTYASGPQISELTPPRGSECGGTLVQITGTGFEGAEVVVGEREFFIDPPTVTPTLISGVTAPATSEGTVSVTVRLPDSECSVSDSAPFTYEQDDCFPLLSNRIDTGLSGTLIVAIGDMNDDSHNDIVLATYDGNLIRIYFGDEAGAFATPMDLTADPADRITALAVADLGGDGRDDIVFAAKGSNRVARALQTAPGIIEVQPDGVSVGVEPWDVVRARLDTDALDDVAVSLRDGHLVVPLFGEPDGTLAEGTALPPLLGGYPVSLAAGAPAGGTLESIVAVCLPRDGSTVPRLAVCWNTSTAAAFSWSVTETDMIDGGTAYGLSDVTLADYNPDVAGSEAVASAVGTNKVYLAHGLSIDGVDYTSTADIGVASTLLAAGHFLSPGPGDELAAASSSGGFNRLYLYSTAATLPARTYRLESFPFSVVAGRLDADGLDDVVVGPGEGGIVSVFLSSK